MLLTTLCVVKGYARHLVPTVALFGTAPSFVVFWIGARLAISPFCTRKVQDELDDFLWGLYQRSCLFFYESVNPTKVILHGDVSDLLQRSESVLYMSNHQSSMDWVVVDMLAARQRGGTIGRLRYVLKDALRHIPLYGLYFFVHGCIYVRRGKFSEESMRHALWRMVRRSRSWLVIFPEGTRMNILDQNQLARAQAFAIENQRPVFNNVLLPKHRALQVATNNVYHYFDAVLDVTIGYSQSRRNGIRTQAPTMFEYLEADASQELHIHIQRIPMNAVNSLHSDQDWQTWLDKRFAVKEQLMQHFFRHGTFAGALINVQALRKIEADEHAKAGLTGDLLREEQAQDEMLQKFETESRLHTKTADDSSNNNLFIITNDDTENHYGNADESGKILTSDFDDSRRHVLPIRKTLPAVLAFAALNYTLLCTRTGRMVYAGSLVGGSLICVAWSALGKT